MKKLVLIISLLYSFGLHAQDKKVIIDKNARQVNGGNNMPAGTYFTLEGAVPDDVVWVDVQLFSGSKNTRPLFSDSWKRSPYFSNTLFTIPVDQKLKFGSVYRLHADYYSTLKGEELNGLRQRIITNVDYYLDARINIKEDEIKLGSKTGQMLSELNDIVAKSFVYYNSPHSPQFPGFSDLVKIKLEQIDKANLNDGRYNVTPTDSTLQMLNVAYANELKIALHNIIVSEIDNYLSYGVVVKSDELNINNLETERSRGFLPVEIGYGAVAFNTDFKDLETDQQPYVGIAIPFGNPRFSRFLGNASLSFGVFLQNFKNPAGQKVTGPIINIPSYLALGYRIFEFIKINAGFTALSTERIGIGNIRTDNVQLKPFVGISAQIDFSLRLGKNR